MKWLIPLGLMMFLGGVMMVASAFFIEDTPGPTPEPDEPVIVDPDFEGTRRVLVVYESEDKPSYPSSQAVILDSASFKQYLNSVCEDDGWRIVDQDVNTSFMDEKWKSWLRRDRSTLPWIMISNDGRGLEQPLPDTIEETKALIEGLR